MSSVGTERGQVRGTIGRRKGKKRRREWNKVLS